MRRDLPILLFLVAVLAICLSTSAVQREANTFRVCPEGCTYNSIQAAINQAKSGDTVRVKPGIYKENISFKGKAITVKSVDSQDSSTVSNTVIKGKKKGSVVTFNKGDLSTKRETKVPFQAIKSNCYGEIKMSKAEFLLSEVGRECVVTGWVEETLSEGEAQENDTKSTKDTTPQAVLSGFTITKGSGTLTSFQVPTHIWKEEGGFPRTEKLGGGVLINSGSTPKIKNNLIKDNKAYLGGGIFVQGESSKVKIVGNTFSNNVAFYGGGICTKGSNPQIKDNRFVSNLGYFKGGAVHIREDSDPRITGNYFTENRAWVGSSLHFSRSSPTIKNNRFVKNHDFRHGTIKSLDSDSVIQSNKFRVNTGGEGGAIQLKGESSSRIADNVFKGNSAHYVGAGIYIATRGTNPEIKIVNNEFINNNVQRSGGAINIKNDCALTIKENKFVGNSAARGGAISMNKGAEPKIVSNTLRDNESIHEAGGVMIKNSSPTIKGNSIIRNEGPLGGGVLIEGKKSKPKIIKNSIKNNESDKGGGIALEGITDGLIKGNNINGNNSWIGGGIAVSNSSPVIKENLITDNSAGHFGGGLILMEGSESVIIDNDFEKNEAKDHGGAIFVDANSSMLDTTETPITNPGEFNKFGDNSPERVFYEEK
ncbi:right-handed parallel beta-helix repeat-containing protein [Candidatus Bipolaricaulota bacterium]|nr:right-handed parallel beta-helix repeat-containing protein [Candidatus Bipolaricaulota bacterium]